MSGLGDRHPFVVFADDYGRHPSSAQHLFGQIPRSHPLFWVNTVGLRRPRLSASDLRRAWGVLRGWRSRGDAGDEEPLASPRGPVRILRPRMSPFSPTGWSRRYNHRSLLRSLHEALAGHPAPVVVTTLPLTADLVGELGEALHVYYCVDDYTQWPGGYGPALRGLEAELLARVDGVLATSRRLFESRRPASGRALYFPHGVDRERFATARGGEHPALGGLGRPRVGYVGLLDDRHDLPLWEALVHSLPELQFVVVGPRQVEPSWLRRLPNLHVIDAVPYEEMPAILGGLDVAILPYRRADAGLSINPLKAKEILAAGLPLVATPLPELSDWPSAVLPATGVEGFREGILRALQQDPRRRREEVARFLQGESWAEKASLFEGTLESWLREKGEGHA